MAFSYRSGRKIAGKKIGALTVLRTRGKCFASFIRSHSPLSIHPRFLSYLRSKISLVGYSCVSLSRCSLNHARLRCREGKRAGIGATSRAAVRAEGSLTPRVAARLRARARLPHSPTLRLSFFLGRREILLSRSVGRASLPGAALCARTPTYWRILRERAERGARERCSPFSAVCTRTLEASRAPQARPSLTPAGRALHSTPTDHRRRAATLDPRPGCTLGALPRTPCACARDDPTRRGRGTRRQIRECWDTPGTEIGIGKRLRRSSLLPGDDAAAVTSAGQSPLDLHGLERTRY